LTEKDPKIAAVACKMVLMDDPARISSVDGMGTPFWRGFVDIGRNELDRAQNDSVGLEPF
jgi:hypothetical protein